MSTKCSLFPVSIKGRFGYINAEGHLVVPAQFRQATPFYNGFAKVKFNDAWLPINMNGVILYKKIYKELGSFEEGLCRVRLVNKWGFISEDGEEKIPAQFTAALDFSEGYASVARGSWGLIGTNGEEILPFVYSYLSKVEGGRCIAKDQQGNWRCLDLLGTTLKSLDIQSIQYVEEGIYRFKDSKSSSVFLLNLMEENLCLHAVDELHSIQEMAYFSEGLANLAFKEGYRLINAKAQWVGEGIYDFLGDSMEGKIAFKQDGRYGFLDANGGQIIAPRFEDVGGFSCGLAPFLKSTKWGYINTLGEEVIAPIYDQVEHFNGALAFVLDKGQWKYIDKGGNCVWPH